MHTNQEIKGNLARLLATENLIVEHRKTETAMFDVDRRVLTLPLWDHASDTVYNMLVGHEVGHALFTPNDDWRSIADCPKDFVNVIEDARIEKLMKRKFPGLRKDFSVAYRELFNKDFFSVADQDLSELTLIDRINLHFKIGANALIPFSIEEKLFVARTDVAETFEEVLQIAVDIHKFMNEPEVVTESVATPDTDESAQPQTNMGGQSQNKSESSDSDDEGEQNEVSTQAGGFNGGASSAPGQSKSSGTELEDVSDDEEEGDLTEGSSRGGDTCETQRSFNEAMEDLSSRHRRDPIYIEIPEKVDLDNHIVDWKVLHGWINEQAQAPELYETVDALYNDFKKQSQKEVNYLVKEFECKKSADAYARSGESKTGVLDTSKLHTYRYNEDIFKKVTIVPDGKNHGLLFILDWSGSMANELLATVKQVLNLTAFCKKVQIPFEVYAFTNEWYAAKRAMENDTSLEDQQSQRRNYEWYHDNRHEGIEKNVFHLDPNYFHLMNFVSSRTNSREYDMQCRNLFREAMTFRSHVEYSNTWGVGLSGTPLNESIVMLNYIIPNFKKKNDLQKVNVCILSDGDACSSTYGQEVYDDYKDVTKVVPRRIDWYQILRDRKTGRVYNAFDYENCTNIFINQVRDRHPEVNVIGFRILAGGMLQNFVCRYGSNEDTDYMKIRQQWKKNKSAIIPNPKGYNALYAISNNSLTADTQFDVESGAKKGDISRAFKKMLGNKSNNKKLLSSFIDYVA